jgi:hypothetical protein
MLGVYRLITTIAAAGMLAGPASLLAQQGLDRPSSPREQWHQEHRLERRGRLFEYQGRHWERRGDRLQRRGERWRREGSPRRGEVLERRGRHWDRRGERLERRGLRKQWNAERLERRAWLRHRHHLDI